MLYVFFLNIHPIIFLFSHLTFSFFSRLI